MDSKTTVGSQNNKKLIVLGLVSIGILFLVYARFENTEITPDAISSIERISVAFYIILLISFSAIGIGLRKYQKRISNTSFKSTFWP